VNEKHPISLVVITCNEERNIARCLGAADFCREMIVVDSGSTDRTIEIARALGARVMHRDWSGYGDQKNFGTAHAENDWVLCIDADEVVSEELRQSILAAFRTAPTVDAFEINRRGFYAGTPIRHSGWSPQWRTFLYRKGCAEWGGQEPHSVVIFRGRSKTRLAGELRHFTYASIRQHVAKNTASAQAAAEGMVREGRRATLAGLLVRPPWAFVRSYIAQLGFLDGFYGFVIGVMNAHYTFIKYAVFRELMRQSKVATDADAR